MKPETRTPDTYPNHVEPPSPVRDRRLSGAHWWDPDRLRHIEDMPRFCPACGIAVIESGGIAIEYWEGEDRVYHVWCHSCRWTGNVVRVFRMIGHEAEL